MPILSRVSSKTGQVLSGFLLDVEFSIEMWGGKGDDVAIFPKDGDYPGSSMGLSSDSPQRKGGNGGYTKLDMIVPSNYTIQIRPQYYAGGEWGGGYASGFGIKNEWLSVVGGGGGAGFNSLYRFGPPEFGGGLQFFSANAGGNGSGGYSSSGTPSNGNNGSACNGSEPSRDNLYGSRLSGGGGGGSPGGNSPGAVSSCNGFWYNPGGDGSGGTGGSGNIRIYKDQGILDGPLNIFPGVHMKYISSSTGSNNGGPKVRITNKRTGNYIDYTNNVNIRMIKIYKI
jgi:hypothetical protein